MTTKLNNSKLTALTGLIYVNAANINSFTHLTLLLGVPKMIMFGLLDDKLLFITWAMYLVVLPHKFHLNFWV